MPERRTSGHASGRPWPNSWEPLVEEAARCLAHARGDPRRGAAVEGLGIEGPAFPPGSRPIFGGCSLTEAGLPPASLCAETTAIGHACAEGARAVGRLVVVGPGPQGAPSPCGRCLQVLIEFGQDIEIRWGTPERERGRARIGTLLPHAFLDYRGGIREKEGSR